MAGCYSEAFFACSYNEDDVLAMLLSGSMNAEAAKYSAKQAFYDPGWFFGQLGKYRHSAKNGDYETQLMSAVTAAGGWPTGYHDNRVSTLLDLRNRYPWLFERYDLDFLKAAEALQ